MLVEELNAASSLLDHALRRYIKACSALEKCTVTRSVFIRLQDELATVAAYKTRILQAELALSRARNNPSPLVMINSLPPEVMSHIFHLVSSSQGCIGEQINGRPSPEFPKYPELLSHVCSRWRQISIGCCSLWAHIDLVPFHRFSRGLVARARTHVSRATPLTLTAHIVNPNRQNPSSFNRFDFIQFLASISPQMQTLELIIFRNNMTFNSAILETCFACSVPGTLARVIIHNLLFGVACNFIESSENPFRAMSMLLDVPHQQLEGVWHSTNALNLNAYFPPWTSRAYHGLAELRLSAFGLAWDFPRPTEAQFINILSSSPRLRILQLGFELDDCHLNDDSIVPVQLDDLETLGLASPNFDQVAAFLRLIAPGMTPLEMSVTLGVGSEAPTPIFVNNAQRFFARSNVMSFTMGASEGYQWADTVMRVLPSLEHLRLESFACDTRFASILASSNQSSSARHSRFNNLYIRSSSIDMNGLRQMIQNHLVQTLELRDCIVSSDGRNILEREVRRQLSDTGVIVKL